MKGSGVIVCTLFAILALTTATDRRHFHHGHGTKHHVLHDETVQDEKLTVKRINKEGACPHSGVSEGSCEHAAVEHCSGDSDCEGKMKCCSDGCGTRCQEPVKEQQCPIPCPKIYDPVCGSDGVTYASECWLRDVKCSRNQAFIKVLTEGECHRQKSQPPCESELQKYLVPSKAGMIGQTLPQCDENGFYKPMQCSGSSGSCWCVTRDGLRLETTEDMFITSDNDCLKLLDDPK